uniref:Fungal pheromone STE3G-protein-coupled receptor n=1 Tax=Mycena chlorophos TaxID=658473 RepID=A0ABQ0KUD0_MYCCL|nr:fungal pheromone STE3G-protein-coupled receptor [Mycena chlorophos]
MAFPLALIPFTALILVLSTLPHHWEMRPGSFATLSIIAWLAIHNLIDGIKAVLWAKTAESLGLAANIWCDIATKIMLGCSIGLPGCCLCIARRLYRITSGNDVGERKLNDWIIDIWLCWGMPFLVMALHIIVQSHRFDILEPFGCQPTIYFSWPALVIITLPVTICGCVSAIYSTGTFYALCKRHRSVRMRIAYHSTLSVGRKGNGVNLPRRAMHFATFIRLLIANLLVGTVTAGFIITSMFIDLDSNQGGEMLVWDNWADVHYGFGAIYSFDLAEYRGIELAELWLFWACWPIGSTIFFLIFGLGKDIRREWRERMQRLIAWFHRRSSSTQTKAGVASVEAGEQEQSTVQDSVFDPEWDEVIIIGPQSPAEMLGQASAV